MSFQTPIARRKQPMYSEAEKETILLNLELELETRRRKIQQRLEEDLADFNSRHKQLISNIPRVLRGITVEEFATKYDASITKFMEMAARARVESGAPSADIEASVRKRKQPVDADGPSKSSKTARKASASPTKQLGAANGGDNTPKAARTFLPPRTPSSRPASALSRARFASAQQPIRVVSSPAKKSNAPVPTGEFNPMLPAKTPAYPRAVRQSDRIVSANGSPLANPWSFDPALGTISLNTPPDQRKASGSFKFELKTRSGQTIVLDPDSEVGGGSPLSGLTNSAKKEVHDGVMKLAMRYARMKM